MNHLHILAGSARDGTRPELVLATGGAIAAVRQFFAKHPQDEVIAPYVAEICGLDPIDAMAALCHLLRAGEIEIDVGHHTWTWQFRKSRRRR